MTDLGIAEPVPVAPRIYYPKRNDWPEEMRARLRILLQEGKLNNKQIGAELGVTKNAVCGKIDRCGYASLRPNKPPRPSRSERERARPTRPQGARGTRKHLPPRLPPTPDAIAEYHERRRPYGVQLVDLTHFHCRYPVGDPQKEGFFFCAAPAVSTYCQAHQELCHAPRIYR
jgi:GcrA cell cycle regulator